MYDDEEDNLDLDDLDNPAPETPEKKKKGQKGVSKTQRELAALYDAKRPGVRKGFPKYRPTDPAKDSSRGPGWYIQDQNGFHYWLGLNTDSARKTIQKARRIAYRKQA